MSANPETPQPRPRPSRSKPRAERVLYNRHGVLITDRRFCTDWSYDIAGLAYIERHRGSVHTGVTVALVIAALDVLILAPCAGLAGAPTAQVVALLTVVIPCAVAFYCFKRWPAVFELRAEYRGIPVVLFRTRDEREFGQVARALQRAIEARNAAALIDRIAS